MRRPLLIPHVRRLWRDAHTLQLGLDPQLATVLELDNPASARLLDLLDGSRSERAVIAAAPQLRVTATEAEALLTALRERGLLVARRALLPVGLTDTQRERMAREAGALALAALRRPPPVALPSVAPVLRVTPIAAAVTTRTTAATAPIAAAASAGPVRTAPPAQLAPPAQPAPHAAAAATPVMAAPPERPASPAAPPGAPVMAAPPERPAPPGPRPTALTRPFASAAPRLAAPVGSPTPPAGPRAVSSEAVTPAEMLRRRAAARVLVAGHAWLGALVAAALGAAGIGRLDPALDGWTRVDDAMLGGLLPTDAHRSRASAAADAVRRVAPEAVITPLREGDATFVVRVGSRPGSALSTRGVRQRGAARLDVYLRDGLVVVGPLVPATGGPCGVCLELHRRDRDGTWSVLAAQLATAREAVEVCAVTTALAGAAYAVEEVLRHTDGRPVRTIGASVEISGPGTARRRIWPVHPRCDCSRRRRSSRSVRESEPASNNGS